MPLTDRVLRLGNREGPVVEALRSEVRFHVVPRCTYFRCGQCLLATISESPGRILQKRGNHSRCS
jgi:hypothetical protein